mmetsp:Transcript_70965/g.118862  ORF Transcript_70965/g.118862 Transcript_70965/m.118862 type:complete len:216 (+) Transcript_70965:478-1125(+)
MELWHHIPVHHFDFIDGPPALVLEHVHAVHDAVGGQDVDDALGHGLQDGQQRLVVDVAALHVRLPRAGHPPLRRDARDERAVDEEEPVLEVRQALNERLHEHERLLRVDKQAPQGRGEGDGVLPEPRHEPLLEVQFAAGVRRLRDDVQGHGVQALNPVHHLPNRLLKLLELRRPLQYERGHMRHVVLVHEIDVVDLRHDVLHRTEGGHQSRTQSV